MTDPKRTIEPTAGSHLLDVLQRAAAVADTENEPVFFTFNDVEHMAVPGETPESRKARAEERAGHPILTREEGAERARRDMERRQKEDDEAIAAAEVPTEKEMREAEVPKMESEEAVLKYIHDLVERPHDYGTCVYAMSMAAVAAFNYAAHKLGVTGFQASCADMDILTRTRHLKHGFRLVDYGELLYPQYWDDDEKRPIFQALLRDPDHRERFRKEANKLLDGSEGAVGAVRSHWEMLAKAS